MRTKTSRGLLGLSLPVKLAALVFIAGMMWMTGPDAGSVVASPVAPLSTVAVDAAAPAAPAAIAVVAEVTAPIRRPSSWC